VNFDFTSAVNYFKNAIRWKLATIGLGKLGQVGWLLG